MSLLENFHFIRPLWLGLAPLALLLWWLGRKADDPLRGWRAVMDRELLRSVTVGQAASEGWRGVSLLVAWLLAVIAVAGPTWRLEPSPFGDNPVPVMLALRADESMSLSDLMPNRMERANLKVADYASQRKGEPLGLVAYAGSAHLVLPPTRDTSIVAAMAAEISPEIMPKPGDNLVAALALAVASLGELGGSIVVVADTVAANVSSLADFADKNKVPIHILAVARPDTPEMDAIQNAASTLNAEVTILTPDDRDILALVRSTARAPISVQDADQGTHWAEAGWSIVPLLVLFSLLSFRRVNTASAMESRT